MEDTTIHCRLEKRHQLRDGPEVEQRLLSHRWMGNLRELNNVVKRAVLLSTTEVVGMEQMPMGSPMPGPGEREMP